MDSNRASLDSNRTSLDSKRTSLDSNRPSLDSKRTSVDSKRTSVDSKRTSSDSNRPSLDSNRTSLDSKRTPLDSNRACADSDWIPLHQQCANALQIGGQLMELLQVPLPAEAMEQVEELIEQRGAIMATIETLLPTAALPPEIEAELQQIMAHQSALEERLRCSLASMQQSMAEGQSTLQQMKSMRQVLAPESESRMLDRRA